MESMEKEKSNKIISGQLKINQKGKIITDSKLVSYDIWNKANTKIHQVKTKENIPYGVRSENGKLKIEGNRSYNIEFLFNKYLEYAEHSPVELIKAKIQYALEEGQWLSYEKARKGISLDSKVLYILKELESL